MPTAFAMRRDWHFRLWTTGWLLWVVFVLAMYYARLWQLFTLGPSAWVAGNYSLASALREWRSLAFGPNAWHLPAHGEAVPRGVIAVFGSGLILCAAYLLGIGMCRLLRWRPDDWREKLLYATAVGLGALAYILLGLAVVGLYYPVSIRILLGVLLLAGIIWLCGKPIALAWPRVGGSATAALAPRHHPGDWLWKALVVLAVLIALVGALAPEQEYDALWYHLGFPRLWLEQGYLVDLPAEYVSLYPMTWGLLFGAGLAVGGPVAAKLLHFACLLLTALLTYQLAVRFFPRSSSWLSVATFVTIPTVLWEASTAYVDLALTLHVGLTLFGLLRYIEARDAPWLGVAAVNLGLALATKHVALLVLPIAMGALAFQLWRKDGNLRRAIAPAALLGGVSLLVPLPWYLRSWLASGNPVFPALFSLFGASPGRWDAMTQQGLDHYFAQFGPQNGFQLLTLPWDMTVHGSRYGGALGPVFLLLLPLLALARRRSRAEAWLISFVVLYFALWASPVSSFQMRFLILVAPMLGVLAAQACGRVTPLLWTTLPSWSRPALHGSLAAVLLLNLPPFTSLHEVDRVGWNGWLTHVIHRPPVGVVIGRESQEDYLVRFVPSYRAWRYINTHLPSNVHVLTFSGGDHLYSQRERLWSDAAIARPAVWGAGRGQERQALQTLGTLGISHVLFDKRQLASVRPGSLAIAQPSVLATWYDMDYEDDRFVLFRLRWERIAANVKDFLSRDQSKNHLPEPRASRARSRNTRLTAY